MFSFTKISIDVQPDNFKSIQENHDDQERMKLYFFTFLTFCFKDATWCPLKRELEQKSYAVGIEKKSLSS